MLHSKRAPSPLTTCPLRTVQSSNRFRIELRSGKRTGTHSPQGSDFANDTQTPPST